MLGSLRLDFHLVTKRANTRLGVLADAWGNNLTQDKDGRADKHICIHPALATGNLTVQRQGDAGAAFSCPCHLRQRELARTAHLEPGLESI
jgi:hypothetical protein